MISSAPSRMAALFVLCRALRGENGLGDPPARRPAVSWRDVVELALELDVAPSLWCSLQASAQTVPQDVADRLRDHYLGNTARNLRLRNELIVALRALNQIGSIPLLFKGSLELVNGSWERRGERWLVDLDLAVLKDELPAAVDALRAIGYAPAEVRPYLRPHETSLVRSQSIGPIEVHVEVGAARLAAVLPAAEAWSTSTPLSFAGVHARALSPTHQVLHCILHSAVQDRNHAVGGLPLKQLIVLRRLVEAHGSMLDWEFIRGRMQAHGLGSEFTAHLRLAQHLIGMGVPVAAWSEVPRARLHELRTVVGFGLPWVTELQRNVRFVMGADYLNWLYSPGDDRLSMARARAGHIARVVRRDRMEALRRAAERKL